MAEAESPPELAPKKEPSKQPSNSTRKQFRQPPSVPFIWEEKPGTPKRDWKPSFNRHVVPDVPPPVKFIASVPFKWEEKPGKALPHFSNQTADTEARNLPASGKALSCLSQPTPEAEEAQLFTKKPTAKASTTPLKPPPCLFQTIPEPAEAELRLSTGNPSKKLPWVSRITPQTPTQKNHRVALSPPPGKPLPWFSQFPTDKDSYNDHNSGESSSETDESFCSAPSLPANLLVSPSEEENNSGPLQTPDSPASEASSYATGTTSLVGVSFLDRLFPLLSPNSGFLEKQKIASGAPVEVKRRPLTLGELIMMSRRRSCQRKAVQKLTQNLSMECMEETATGCCVFGIDNRIEGLQQKWKTQLKLV